MLLPVLGGLALAACTAEDSLIVPVDGVQREASAARSLGPLPEADLSFVSQADPSKCIDVSALDGQQPSAGTPVILWTCHGGVNQRFVWTSSGEIRSGELCLDAYGGEHQDFDRLIVGNCRGGANQRWSTTAAGEIRGSSGKCIDIQHARLEDGAPLILYDCQGEPNQAWVVQRPVACAEHPHKRRVSVATSEQLVQALRSAEPADLIELAAGVYPGRFVIRNSGTETSKIVLCGPRTAILDGGSLSLGAVISLHADYWTLAGFSVTNGLWGVEARHANHNVLRNLEISRLGQEAVHLRSFSTHNIIVDNWIHDTGLLEPQWGEGAYVGSWSGHWCTYSDCQPDRSDYNQILDNHFGPNVTAEHVDIKEGTTGGLVRGNTFDGRGSGGSAEGIDSWVVVQGNDYLIEHNQGAASLRHGYRVWPGADGEWGQRNIFRHNVVDLRAAGYGFYLQGNVIGNRIYCNNTVTNAGSGFANVSCVSE